MKKGFILLFIAIGIVAIILSFTITKTVMNGMKTLGKNNNKETISKINTTGKVEIINYTCENGVVKVRYKNNTDKTLKMINIIVHCWDKDNNNIGDRNIIKWNINTKDVYKTTILCDYNTERCQIEIKY